jgi:23S rRNA G2069 N7-methylase RlmK/C1962 C5-methylase RlmI
MIKTCLGLLNPKGWLLISTNCSELSKQDLSRMAVNASRELKGKIHFKEEKVPEDFSKEAMPQTLWAQIISS